MNDSSNAVLKALGLEGHLVVTRNRGTLFVEHNGQLLADSATFNGVRGFHNKATGEWVAAGGFTPRNVKADPAKVVSFLLKTGTLTACPVFIAF